MKTAELSRDEVGNKRFAFVVPPVACVSGTVRGAGGYCETIVKSGGVGRTTYVGSETRHHLRFVVETPEGRDLPIHLVDAKFAVADGHQVSVLIVTADDQVIVRELWNHNTLQWHRANSSWSAARLVERKTRFWGTWLTALGITVLGALTLAATSTSSETLKEQAPFLVELSLRPAAALADWFHGGSLSRDRLVGSMLLGLAGLVPMSWIAVNAILAPLTAYRAHRIASAAQNLKNHRIRDRNSPRS